MAWGGIESLTRALKVPLRLQKQVEGKKAERDIHIAKKQNVLLVSLNLKSQLNSAHKD